MFKKFGVFGAIFLFIFLGVVVVLVTQNMALNAKNKSYQAMLIAKTEELNKFKAQESSIADKQSLLLKANSDLSAQLDSIKNQLSSAEKTLSSYDERIMEKENVIKSLGDEKLQIVQELIALRGEKDQLQKKSSDLEDFLKTSTGSCEYKPSKKSTNVPKELLVGNEGFVIKDGVYVLLGDEQTKNV